MKTGEDPDYTTIFSWSKIKTDTGHNLSAVCHHICCRGKGTNIKNKLASGGGGRTEDYDKDLESFVVHSQPSERSCLTLETTNNQVRCRNAILNIHTPIILIPLHKSQWGTNPRCPLNWRG